ncbi:hypothetical protein HanPSC8_Chr08g0334181 [Helianthus annuus]|nr:hypothetical protein HanPSC8_Chr08g0334181 [Helianthus annuus]
MRKRSRSKDFDVVGDDPIQMKAFTQRANEKFQHLQKVTSILGNRRIYRKEQRGIASAVQLQDPTILNLDKKYPVSILMSLTHSKKCCKQIVDSGGLVYLQKLVEMEVNGAKKL